MTLSFTSCFTHNSAGLGMAGVSLGVAEAVGRGDDVWVGDLLGRGVTVFIGVTVNVMVDVLVAVGFRTSSGGLFLHPDVRTARLMVASKSITRASCAGNEDLFITHLEYSWIKGV